jgi:hypothetical protein
MNRDHPIGMLVGAMQRARDEIVALREQLDRAATSGSGFTGILAGAVSVEEKRWMKEAAPQIRAEALEEAARMCERQVPPTADRYGALYTACDVCAAAIRALKEKRGE